MQNVEPTSSPNFFQEVRVGFIAIDKDKELPAFLRAPTSSIQIDTFSTRLVQMW